MDLITVVEKYIEFSIQRDKLEKIIETESRGIDYATIEANEAYHENEYDREQAYWSSVKNHRDLKQQSIESLNSVKQMIASLDELYKIHMSSIDRRPVIAAADYMEYKKRESQRKINELNQKLEWSHKKWEEEFNNKNLEAEISYGRMCSDCKIEIAAENHRLLYFESFANALKNNHLNDLFLKSEEPSGPKM